MSVDSIINSSPVGRPYTNTCSHHTQADDELEKPYLAGFEWDKEESYTKFIVHQKLTGEAPASSGGKKKGKKNKDDEGGS